MEIRGFTPRDYQNSILKTCLKSNTLVVLPTGLGKTKTAILSIVERLKLFPKSKALFLTPTKPLGSQIQKEILTNTTIEDVVLFSGEIAPEEREKLVESAKVIVSTPQTISNDIINGRIDLSTISLLVIDEVHRAVGDYDYVWVAKQYLKKASYPRLIGLTASPGSDRETITKVCRNTFVEEIEIRNYDDNDVKDYVQDLETIWEKLELPLDFKILRKFLEDSYFSKLTALKSLGINVNKSTTKTELIRMMGSVQGQLARGIKDYQLMRGISIISEAMKVQHALEMLETQGMGALHNYMKRTFDEAEKTKTKAIKNLVKDVNFHTAYLKCKVMVEQNVKHPKLIKLIDIVNDEINKVGKIIVFNQYRDSAVVVKDELNKLDNVKAEIFVGQVKKGSTGLTQKKQLEMLDRFRSGEINVLVSTNIGEEGLDIPDVDLVIFFEPIPSAIRNIQRRGRTARHKEGKLIVLITKNTRDEAYHWVARNKEKRMYKVLNELKLEKRRKIENPTLASFDKILKVKADSREKGSMVLKHLVDLGVEVNTSNLDYGDFVINDRICIERKSVSDFVASIIDKRLLSQLIGMREHFEKPLLIIEGDEDIFSVRNIHPNAIRGMLSVIAVSYSIPILYAKSQEDTAELIRAILKREYDPNKKDIGLRLERKPLSTNEQQQFIVESFPGVGPSLAKHLLNKFGTVKNIANSSVDELKETEKIGIKKAEEIFRVLNDQYD